MITQTIYSLHNIDDSNSTIDIAANLPTVNQLYVYLNHLFENTVKQIFVKITEDEREFYPNDQINHLRIFDVAFTDGSIKSYYFEEFVIAKFH